MDNLSGFLGESFSTKSGKIDSIVNMFTSYLKAIGAKDNEYKISVVNVDYVKVSI